MFDINDFKPSHSKTGRYDDRLSTLLASGISIACIKQAVDQAIENISKNGNKSFVVYGEPQSGKTEMMIALTAKLLDEGHRVIIHLLNDSIQLLEQNLDRFKRSGLAPSPKSFNDVLDPDLKVKDGEWVVFCKKNARDLNKLIDKFDSVGEMVVIDDEADFATPNAKINKGEKTKINELIGKLLGEDGIYIGVTATPARLDLNNTFDNDSELWVDFPPHDKYTGQEIFFPIEGQLKFHPNLISDSGDDPKYIREALFRFLINVAFLNLYKNSIHQNYCILVHTSGKKADHRADRKAVEKVFSVLNAPDGARYEAYIKRIWGIAEAKYPGKQDEITKYIAKNVSRYSIVVMNSERDKNTDFKSATSPATLFTVAIGGNIVSRGVTFENLLSMFFTRDVKHKIQQDTYIQRARMFGARGDYLDCFELTIPEQLYLDWHRCFVFHRLALTAIKEGKGSPVWLADKRVAVAAASSINKATVSMDSGEMAFGIFDYDESFEEIIEQNVSVFERLEKLRNEIGEDRFPEFLISYIRRVCPDGDESVALHPSSSIENYKDAEGLDKDKIERARGFFGRPQMQKEQYPKALHHLKIFHNGKGKGRLFYKFDGSIQFIKNLHKAAISKNVQ